MKFSAVRGTVSQKTSILMSPNVVSRVTDMAELPGQQMEDGGGGRSLSEMGGVSIKFRRHGCLVLACVLCGVLGVDN